MTSYNHSRDEEEKIRKSSDLHGCLVNSSLRDTDAAQSNTDFGSENSPFSESKDKIFQSTLQQFEEINLLKAKKGSPLGTEIENLLKEGEIIRFYKDGKGYNKKILSLGKHIVVISETPVYDDEDNFNTKHWIVTSYDPTTSMEDKEIRKATSEDIAFKKEPNCANSSQFLCDSRKNHLGADQSLPVSLPMSLSESKDKTFQSTLQQFEEINLLKAKKGSPLGTEKEWGGKIYIKTTNGWRPKSKKSSKQEDDSGNKSQKSEEEDSKKGSSFFC